MIDDNDHFDQPPEFEDLGEPDQKRGQFASNIAEAWRTKPLFKLLVLMIGVGAIVAGLIGFFTPTPEIGASRVAAVPELKEAPGGKASPAFIEAQAQANQQRIKEQAQIGGSAIPTPLPSGITVESHKENDPLIQFRAELEKQKEEQRRQIQVLQQQQTQNQQVSVQQDQQRLERISTAMSAQMGQMIELWKPKGMSTISGKEDKDKKTGPGGAAGGDGGGGNFYAPAGSASQASPAMTATVTPKAFISAGAVAYAQLLTEANSDVPGPILAQILSGPLSGARAIGSFKVVDDYLVLTFNLATLKGKDYSISTLALDPDTTLGALATEVDHRYIARVALPAAGAFIAELGQSLGQKPTSTTVTQNGIVVDQARTGIKDGLYAGMGAAGESVASFLKSEANATKVLVRVEVGTPMGLFFTTSVKEDGGRPTFAGGNAPRPGGGMPESADTRSQAPLYPVTAQTGGSQGTVGAGFIPPASYAPTGRPTTPGYGYR
ncbi:MAG: hypothetical protein WDO70_03665 [Alphaproteobacteria bacterium]